MQVSFACDLKMNSHVVLIMRSSMFNRSRSPYVVAVS